MRKGKKVIQSSGKERGREKMRAAGNLLLVEQEAVS